MTGTGSPDGHGGRSAVPAEGPDPVERAIEAVLMAAPEPVPASVLAQLLEVPRETVERACASLAADYEAAGRGFVLARVAGGYRFQTHPDLAPYVERFVRESHRARLSAAALETLAIVAYKQPISRAQIAAIRGVNVDSVVATLVERGYIAEVGRDRGPGNAVLYGTTPTFLDHLGLDSIDQLPPLSEFVPGPEVVERLEQTLLGASSVSADDGAGTARNHGDGAGDGGEYPTAG